MLLAALLAFGGVWCWLPSQSGRGVDRVLPPHKAPGRQGPRAPLVESPRQRTLSCLLGAAASGWVLAGPVGIVVGIPVGLALSWWVSRLESPSATRSREQIANDLPLAADLLAACAAAGRPPDQCLDLVSRAVGGALGQRLDAITARLALGADPSTEWSRLGSEDQLAPLGRTLMRTAESGAPLVEGLSRLAADRRRERRTQTQLRARSVGVKAAGPLAACFLPAFMLIGVVPTIAGAFSNLVL